MSEWDKLMLNDFTTDYSDLHRLFLIKLILLNFQLLKC